METIIYVTLIIGILNTIYLTTVALLGKNVYCFMLPEAWCLKVQHSKYSKTFGIRNPLLGLGMLIVISIGYYLSTTGVLPLLYTYLVICGGFLFSVYFLYVQAFIIKAFCTWCVLSFLVFTALFIETTMLMF